MHCKPCSMLLAAVLALSQELTLTSADCSAAWASCGSDSTTPSCCPDKYYCQPWDAGYYQCIALPDQCQQQLTNVDFYGNDIKTINGIQPKECCAQCQQTQGCVAYTFVNSNPGSPACYLKNGTTGQTKKIGAVSGIVTATALCPTPLQDTDFYGADLTSVTGSSAGACCNACSTTAGCAAYTFVAADSKCYLKTGKGTQQAKTGVVSGVLSTATQCPTPLQDTDFYGADLTSVTGSSAGACCNACSTTAGCAAYTFVAADSKCYLKTGKGTQQAKTGVVSGVLSTATLTPTPTTQPPTTAPVPTTTPTPSCSTPSYGQCGDAKGSKCCPSGFYCQPWNDAYYQCIPPPAKCAAPLTDTDYYGNDIATVNVDHPTKCCDACASTAGCKAFTYINNNPGQPVCYLKSAAGNKKTLVGAVAGTLL